VEADGLNDTLGNQARPCPYTPQGCTEKPSAKDRSSRAGKRSWVIYSHSRWYRFLDGILAENGLDDLSMASWWDP
jgi:hypothetical protein